MVSSLRCRERKNPGRDRSAGWVHLLAIPSRDEYYIAYHRFKIPGGDGTHRETCIDRLYFNSDGSIVPVKPTLDGLQAAVSP